MELGFETIGNATVICHDQIPVLSTDPWITDQAYFGSWTHSHQIPTDQLEAIKKSKFIWFSHGHPDHLNPFSLPYFQKNKILIPAHVGQRIHHDLLAQNFDVTVLDDRQWTKLSDKIRIMCIADYNQDAILLIDIGGTLIVNANDAGLTGWERTVGKIIKQYKTTFFLAISGFGEADMCNFFNVDGTKLHFLPDKNSFQIGKITARNTDRLGAKFFIPFSSMHKYQREDSNWANEYIPSLEDYAKGFVSTRSEILPAFIKYDCIRETIERINPEPTDAQIIKPIEFGDNWDDLLSSSDIKRAQDYFTSIEHLADFLDFVNLRVGGKDNIIELSKKRFDRGICFEAPRTSLMKAITGGIFDDLLIGNFMKTTLIGKWGRGRLYPDFTPYVAKYGDNGYAKTKNELKAYFSEYRSRNTMEYLIHQCEQGGINFVMNSYSDTSPVYRMAQRVYSLLKFKRVESK